MLTVEYKRLTNMVANSENIDNCPSSTTTTNAPPEEVA
ncbi:hypothetical protein HSB1_20120 [Halogranum salarium B-1]|uniref:Uncharacterized protein n=1 Tax=Halogranum salarium B-1 TaxID=1210908 RepID=J3JG61_9EURY|nr:hypothetical protein HSB1_20120 [Halogranum salarium B-1]